MTVDIKETVIAGGPEDYLQATRLVLRGTNREIGHALGTIARNEHGARPEQARDPVVAKAARRYHHDHYPILEERCLGASDAFGIREDDELGMVLLIGHLFVPPGCSVCYIPPHKTVDGNGLVSRNMDFPRTAQSGLFGMPPVEGEPQLYSRPYMIEMHPDQGYASLSMCCFDLLGALDGINSEGLTVAGLTDEETMEKGLAKPTLAPAVGIEFLQTIQMLLDTCATVAEAKETLLTTKHYYLAVPAHFLVADRHGNSFVWEHGSHHNAEYIMDGGGDVQIVTNDLLHRVAAEGELTDSDPFWSRERRCRLSEAIQASSGKLTVSELAEAHAVVDFTPSFISELRGEDSKSATIVTDGARTMWHGVFDTEARSLTISFYLGENEKGEVRRSPYKTFVLEAGD